MKKANAGLMVAGKAVGDIAKTKAGQKAIETTSSNVNQSMQTANRVQSIVGWTITGLIVLGAGYLVYRFLIKPSLDKAETNQENRAAMKEAELVLKEYDKLGLKVDPLKDMKAIADRISAALNGYTEDDDAIAAALQIMGNDAEFEALRAAWGGVDGTRPVTGGMFGGGNFSLTAAIQKYLDDDNKAQVNMNYDSKNMKTRV